MESRSTEKKRLVRPPPLVALNVWVVRLWAVRIDTENQRRRLALEPLGDGFQRAWLDLAPACAGWSMKRTNRHDFAIRLYSGDERALGKDESRNERAGIKAGPSGA